MKSLSHVFHMLTSLSKRRKIFLASTPVQILIQMYYEKQIFLSKIGFLKKWGPRSLSQERNCQEQLKRSILNIYFKGGDSLGKTFLM